MHQSVFAGRWVGSCRRDLLDHVIALNEGHLKRLLSEYVCYYHEDRNASWPCEASIGRQNSLPFLSQEEIFFSFK